MFVAILKQFVLKDVLKRYQWVGILLNCLSIVLVGFTAMMIEASSSAAAVAAGTASEAGSESTAFLGVVLILLGALVQSLQYVFEEKVMSAAEDDPNVAPTPPLLLVSVSVFVVLAEVKSLMRLVLLALFFPIFMTLLSSSPS